MLLATACVALDSSVALVVREPAGAIVAEGGPVVRIEPVVDGRAVSLLGRMRNGYFWEMARFVPEEQNSVSDYFTRRLENTFAEAGMRLASADFEGPDCIIRARVLRLYADTGYTVQTSARLQLDVWRDERFTSHVYEGASNRIALVPTSEAERAFDDALEELFLDLRADLPDGLCARSATQ
jgi:hypothetical protein